VDPNEAHAAASQDLSQGEICNGGSGSDSTDNSNIAAVD